MTKPINIDNAIRHLTEKMGDTVREGRSFRPSRYDVRCLNSIVEYRNRDRKEKPNEHILFSKLYVYLFYQFVIHFKSTNLKEMATWMGRVLDKPYSLLIQEFMMFSDIYLEGEVLRESGIPEPSTHIPSLRSDEENKALQEAWNKLTPDDMQRLMDIKWNYHDAVDFFDELISNVLNIYSHQK